MLHLHDAQDLIKLMTTIATAAIPFISNILEQQKKRNILL